MERAEDRHPAEAPSGPTAPPTRPRIDAGTLWAGGIATAAVAALVAGVGTVICGAVLSIELVHVGLPGRPKGQNTLAYPTVAALVALGATGVLHLLSVFAPRPLLFFNWIIGLVGLLGAALPFVSGFSASSLATAVVNVVTVAAIAALVGSSGARALRAPRRPTGPAQRPPAGS